VSEGVGSDQSRKWPARVSRWLRDIARWTAFACSFQGAAFAADHPADYDKFVSVSPGTSLAGAAAANSELYLPPGRHLVDNPVVIARDEPLFIHGADRMQTMLVPMHPDRPMFVIEKATLVNLTNLQLQGPANEGSIGFVALETRNGSPIEVEIQDCAVVDAGLVFGGGGSIRLQGTSLMPHGRVPSPIVVDHPDARFVMVGGNISNEHSPARSPQSSYFHIWIKRGHLQVFGTGVQATHGRADFRIDSASPGSPHVIANVRSEGNNGARSGQFPSQLLYVPPSSAAVDVLLVANGASWPEQDMGKGALVDYSAAGTLWLVGNNGSLGAGSLVVGTAPRATLVALGNVSFDGDRLFRNPSLRRFADLNLYSYRFKTGIPVPPLVRFARDEAPPGQKAPPIPVVDVPAPLTRPTVNAPLPGMLNVRDFGAVGDDVADDTDEIQSALDSACDGNVAKRLYFPAGTYRVKRILRMNDRKGGCQKHPAGGWIAGAGRERTILHRVGAGGVFSTEGLAYVTVQGITFRTTPGGSESAFALEYFPGVGHASQGVSFYDVRFDGGRHALGIGLASETQCSENLLVDAEFRNAEYGLAVGSYNALANLVYRGSFVDNGIAMGHPEDKMSGGTWAVLGASVRGTRRQDVALQNSANGVWYFHGLDSTSPVLVTTAITGAVFPLSFESSRFAPPVGSPLPFVDFSAAGGPIFLHSQVDRGLVRVRGSIAANYAIAEDSIVPSWGRAESLGHGRKSTIEPAQ